MPHHTTGRLLSFMAAIGVCIWPRWWCAYWPRLFVGTVDSSHAARVVLSDAGPPKSLTARWCSGGVLPDGLERDAYNAAVKVDSREGIMAQFASHIYRKRIIEDLEQIRTLNEDLILNFNRLAVRDEDGKTWSQAHYAGGYTTYFSLPALQKWVPPVAELEKLLDPHIRDFQQSVLPDSPPLFMTDCWANVMGEGTEHEFHQHNQSTISGTYYVETPGGCSGLLFEDPRLDRTVAAQQRQVVECPAHAGYVVLFESWQRHTVPANHAGSGKRVSVSFNYHWRFESPTELQL